MGRASAIRVILPFNGTVRPLFYRKIEHSGNKKYLAALCYLYRWTVDSETGRRISRSRWRATVHGPKIVCADPRILRIHAALLQLDR